MKMAAPRRPPNKARSGEPAVPQRSLYKRSFRQEEITALESLPTQDLQSEIDLLRVTMRRTFEQIGEDTDLESMANTLRSLGLTASRLGNLVRIQAGLHSKDSDIASGIHDALREAMKGWKITQ